MGVGRVPLLVSGGIIERMKRLIYLVLILGFLFVDLIFFHDVFKPGETTSVGQWLTGLLSIPVIIISLLSLLDPGKNAKLKAL